MPTRRMRRLSGAAGAVLLATTPGRLRRVVPPPQRRLATAAGPAGHDQPSTPPTPKPDPVSLKSNVKNGASNVKVDTLVTVKCRLGTLTKVKLSYTNNDRQGRTQHGTVAGKISKDRTSWTASDRLEPAAAYKLTSVGKNLGQPAQVRTRRLSVPKT